MSLGVIVKQGNELASSARDSLVVGGAEPEIGFVGYATEGERLRELGASHIKAAVRRTIVNQDDFEVDVLLATERMETGAEQIATIPVDDDNRDHLVGLDKFILPIVGSSGMGGTFWH